MISMLCSEQSRSKLTESRTKPSIPAFISVLCSSNMVHPLHCEVDAISHLVPPRENPLLFLVLRILAVCVLVSTPRKTTTLVYLSWAAPVNWGIKRWGQWECSLKMLFKGLSPKIFTLQCLNKLSAMEGWKSNYLSIFFSGRHKELDTQKTCKS